MMEELEKWRDIHSGQDMIVCGCGPSVAELPQTLDIPTIGVNDIWAYHECNYILMLDGPKAFKPERINRIVASMPDRWFLTKAADKSWKTYKKPRQPVTLFDDLLMPGARITTPSLAVGLHFTHTRTHHTILVKSKLEITRTDTDTDTQTHITFTTVKLEINRRKIF